VTEELLLEAKIGEVATVDIGDKRVKFVKIGRDRWVRRGRPNTYDSYSICEMGSVQSVGFER
jgi:hypothetical protein